MAIVHRLDNGTTETEIVSIADISKGVLSIDRPLRNRDVVFVPDAGPGKPSTMSQVTSGLGLLGLVGRLAVGF